MYMESYVGMKSDLKMPAPLQRFVHKPDEKRQLEHCIEKAMMDLLSKCMFGGIMITYNAPGFPLYYIDEQMLSLLTQRTHDRASLQPLHVLSFGDGRSTERPYTGLLG